MPSCSHAICDGRNQQDWLQLYIASLGMSRVHLAFTCRQLANGQSDEPHLIASTLRTVWALDRPMGTLHFAFTIEMTSSRHTFV